MHFGFDFITIYPIFIYSCMAIINDKFKILFFGTDIFSFRTLKPIIESRCFENFEIVTKPQCDVETFAEENNLNYHYWKPNFSDNFNSNVKPNIGLVSSFGNLIDVNTIRLFKYGLFNLHPSLLPKYRGSTPIQHAILNGDSETGLTIFQIPPIEKFDVGDIIVQRKVNIKEKEYAQQLSVRLASIGSEMFIELLKNYDKCMLNKRAQGSEGRSYAKKIKPERGLLNFKTESFVDIERKVRAFTGWIDLYFLWKDKRVYVYDMIFIDLGKVDSVYEELFSSTPTLGSIFFSRNNAICIKCRDNKWLAFRKVRMENKPILSALDFSNGYLSKYIHSEAVTDC